ncbi:MAG: V-type ATP synthase subunit A, partial [Saccharolobus sp.]
RFGSVSVASAVSPPGGDFTEPVTSHTLRFVKVFWPLSVSLAQARHYPAINWLQGFSAYVDLVANWWNTNVDPKWKEMRELMVKTLIREDELTQIVRLVGPESLAEKDKLILETARLIKEAFLKQNAYDDIDAFSSPQKQARIMRLIYIFNTRASTLIEKGLPVKKIMDKIGPLLPEIIRSKATIKNDELNKYDELERKLISAFDSLEKEVVS